MVYNRISKYFDSDPSEQEVIVDLTDTQPEAETQPKSQKPEDADPYLADKINVAKNDSSLITKARIIFQKDENGKVFMVARLDEIDLPEEFSPDGDEMFKSEMIIQLYGKAYKDPNLISEPVNPKLFKKKNWQARD